MNLDRTGTMYLHEREWPLYDQPAFEVRVSGYIDEDKLTDGEQLQAQLQQLLEPYGLTVELAPVMRVVMSEEDRKERERLDALQRAGSSHMI